MNEMERYSPNRFFPRLPSPKLPPYLSVCLSIYLSASSTTSEYAPVASISHHVVLLKNDL